MASDPALFPATHSVLSARELATYVQSAYALEPPLDCTLLAQGLNDTYAIETASGTFVLRIYRFGWRSASDIHYELDLLEHLGQDGVSVALPVAARNGRLINTIRAPEGDRFVVLFTSAPGTRPRPDEADSLAFGATAAALHASADDFTTEHERFELDLAHLLDSPLRRLERPFAQRQDSWRFLTGRVPTVRARVSELGPALDWGPCHGDLHRWNAHISKDRTLTLYDFDCGGPGWRAYDLAVFRWALRTNEKGGGKEAWSAFLHAYTERRPLSESDLAAIPLFVFVRHIWFMGLHVHLGAYFGTVWLEDTVERGEKFLREWDREELRGLD